MKRQYVKFALFLLVLINSLPDAAAQKKAAPEGPVFTANALASGNYKDILTSFFQLGFDNLIGPNKSLHFNSNPYAIMLKNNPALAVDREYYKHRVLRKLNFGFGLQLDTSYRFKGFTAGIKYALINKRDSTTSKLLFNNLRNDSLNAEVKLLQQKLVAYLDEKYPAFDSNNNPIAANIKIRKTVNSSMNQMVSFTPYIAFDKLDSTFKDAAIAIAKENGLTVFATLIKKPGVSIQKTLDDTFISLKNAIKMEPLWTIGIVDTSGKDQRLLGNIVIATEFSKGVFKPRPGSNLELNIKAAVNFIEDTAIAGKNLKRSLLNVEPGINWVIRNKANDQSMLEFKFGGSYIHNFGRLHLQEKRDQLMFAGTFRVRVISDIWIPLEFKYDPENGNVFGFLSVKANFTGLGKLLAGNNNN